MVWQRSLFFIVFVATLSGCGSPDDLNNPDASISPMDNIGDLGGTAVGLVELHNMGPDCTQSGCHEKFTVSGTIYETKAGETRLTGETLTMIPVIDGVPNPENAHTHVTDENGNFWDESPHVGKFLIGVGSVKSGPHGLPGRKACNTCHVPGNKGRIYRTPS